jgi:basic membrane protein A
MWNWGPLYTKIAQSVINNTWKPGNPRYDMSSGYTKLSPFGKIVPQKVKQEALALEKKINNGQLVVFQGPLVRSQR